MKIEMRGGEEKRLEMMGGEKIDDRVRMVWPSSSRREG